MFQQRLDLLRKRRQLALERARELGANNNWEKASAFYHEAVAAHRELYRQSLLQSDQFNVLAQELDIFAEAGYAVARAGNVYEAATILEIGRTQILAEAWIRDIVFPAKLSCSDEQTALRYRDITKKISQIECRERSAWSTGISDSDLAPLMDSLRQELAQLRISLEELLQEVEEIIDYQDFVKEQRCKYIEMAVQDGLGIIYIATTIFGSYAVLVAKPKSDQGSKTIYKVCWLDSFREANLLHNIVVLPNFDRFTITLFTVSAVLRSANALSNLGFTDHWFKILEQLENILADVGINLISPLVDFLQENGVDDIALIPYGFLAQVPLHIAPFHKESKPVSLIDYCDICFAPSATFLSLCQISASYSSCSLNICSAVQSTDCKLIGTTHELEHLQSLWPGDEFRWIRMEKVQQNHVIKELCDANYVVLSCHGKFAYWDQLNSGFSSEGHTFLSLNDLLNKKMLQNCRMVVAAACQSAYEDSPTTLDEGISLSMGLIYSGASGVLGALWNVDDLMTAIFITKFHEKLFEAYSNNEQLKPWKILCSIYRSLKNTSLDELQCYVEKVPTLSALFNDYQIDSLTDIFTPDEVGEKDAFNLVQSFEKVPNDKQRDEFLLSWLWGAFIYVGA
jgi:CHAT domain